MTAPPCTPARLAPAGRSPRLALLAALLLACLPALADDLKAVRAEVESGKAVLVDVRERDEWARGHLRDARLMPMSEFASGKAALDSLPRDRPIYLHCAVGSRSRRVAAFLKGKGFDARALSESYGTLVRSGFAEVR